MNQPESVGDGSTDRAARMRSIPSVRALVESEDLRRWRQEVAHEQLVRASRAVLDEYRGQLLSNAAGAMTVRDLAEQVSGRLEASERFQMRPVINATGIILHTGLGRAPLARGAVEAMQQVAGGFANVEVDLKSGQRGQRSNVVRALLTELTGAESAVVVNNNAAATLLVLSAMGGSGPQHPKHVLVSRGELIEIGGSFRLPEIMQVSGVVLREVGTTNKTRRRDYEQAIDGDVAGLMKIHPSNYQIEGFTQSVSIRDLVEVGRAANLPVIHDIGSGALMDFERFGLRDEPTAPDSIAAGADLVLFSGDKLLGGPQAGIIIGQRRWIERIENNPLMRPLRVGKLILAALEATLRLYRDPARAEAELPVLAMAAAPEAALQQRAESISRDLSALADRIDVHLQQTTAYLGGGALPGQGLPSVALKIQPLGSENEFACRLRAGDLPVIARVQDEAVLLDLRTVLPEQDDDLVRAVGRAAEGD